MKLTYTNIKTPGRWGAVVVETYLDATNTAQTREVAYCPLPNDAAYLVRGTRAVAALSEVVEFLEALQTSDSVHDGNWPHPGERYLLQAGPGVTWDDTLNWLIGRVHTAMSPVRMVAA